jgi:transcriptional regulator GlxA family with amidase domain
MERLTTGSHDSNDIKPTIHAIVARSREKEMRSRTVAFLVVPPVQELDLVGPLEVFTGANRVLAERGPGYVLRIVSTGRQRTVAGHCGLSVVTEGHYSKLGRAKVDGTYRRQFQTTARVL